VVYGITWPLFKTCLITGVLKCRTHSDSDEELRISLEAEDLWHWKAPHIFNWSPRGAFKATHLSPKRRQFCKHSREMAIPPIHCSLTRKVLYKIP